MVSKTIRVLSLFSGCGGMDLGLEGGFSIHKGCINEKSNPDFIEKQERGELVKLHSTRFQLVFANDILKEALDPLFRQVRLHAGCLPGGKYRGSRETAQGRGTGFPGKSRRGYRRFPVSGFQCGGET